MNLSLFALSALVGTGAFYGMRRKDPSINLSSCFFDRLATPAFNLLRNFDSNMGLVIDELADNHIFINTPPKKLYGVELIGGDNITNFFDKDSIESMIRDNKKDPYSYFLYAILKQGKYQKQYIFSPSDKIVKQFAARYGLKLMKGTELVNAIFDLHLENTYYELNKQYNRSMSIDANEFEPPYETYTKLIRQSVYNGLKDIDVVQSYKALDITKSDIQGLFKLPFNGSIWTYVDLNQTRIENQISRLITAAKWVGNKEHFLKLKEDYNAKRRELLVINSIAMIKGDYDESIVGSIATSLKSAMIHKELGRKDIIRKTPLKYRDTEFDYLVSAEYLENFITPIHKRATEQPDIFGTDKNEAFTNYSFSEENPAPHSVLIARTGSGKTVAKQKMISQMIGFDYKTGYAENLGKVKVRNYDVGFTDEFYVNHLASHPENDVGIVESDFGSFNYNMVAIDRGDDGMLIESDLQFATDLASVILESQHTEPLSIGESAAFKEAVRSVYEQSKYQSYRIRELEAKHKKIYNRLLELGYTQNSFIRDIAESEFDFLKKPLLLDIQKYVAVQGENNQIKEETRKSNLSLAKKLYDIDQLKLFSTFDSIDIKMLDFLSMDLNNFKESSLFAPIFLCIFQKTYLKDREYALECKRKRIEKPKLVYAIEESKNLFRVKSFEPMLEKVTLEARKYGVHLMFIAQNADHVPEGILKNIDTKIFLLIEEKKNEIVAEVKEYFSPGENVITALKNTDQHELCIWYSKGVFNLNFNFEEAEWKLYNGA